MASSNLLHDWKPIGEEEEAVLEATYKKNPEPPSAVKLDLALELHVSPQNIGRWFSARRKRDQGETRAQRKLPEQVEILEKYFKQNPFPSRAEKAMICNETGCSLKQINSWFQHSRKKRNMTNLDNLPGDYLRTWHEQAAKHIKSAIIAQNTKIFGPQDDGDPEEEDDGGAAAGAEFDDEEDYDEEEDEEDAEDFSPPPSSSKGKGRSSTGGGGGSGSRSSYDPAGTLNTTPRAVTPPSFEHEHEDSTPRAGSSGQAMRRSTRKVSSQPRAAERYIPYSTPDDDASPRGPAAGHRRHASSASMRSFNSTDSGATKVHQSAGGSPLTGHQRLEVPDSHNPHHLRSRGESPEEMGGNRMSSPYGMPNQVARVQPQQQTSGGPSSPAGFGDVQPVSQIKGDERTRSALQTNPDSFSFRHRSSWHSSNSNNCCKWLQANSPPPARNGPRKSSQWPTLPPPNPSKCSASWTSAASSTAFQRTLKFATLTENTGLYRWIGCRASLWVSRRCSSPCRRRCRCLGFRRVLNLLLFRLGSPVR